MSKKAITKKRSVLKTLCKESTLFHVIAGIILAVGVFFLDYAVAVWETKMFGLIVDNGDYGGNIANITLLMFFNAAGAFVAWVAIRIMLKFLRSWISQVIALVHYCYLPLTEDEVRNKFTSAESYIRYMENRLEYIEYCLDGNYLRRKKVTEDDVCKILQVCHKVFGSGSILHGVYNNHSGEYSLYILDGMRFVGRVGKNTEKLINFMNRYMERKEEGLSFKEKTVINEDRTVTLSYSCKYGKHLDKVGTDSITF